MTLSRKLLIVCAVAGLITGTVTQAFSQDPLIITLDTPAGHVRNIWVGKFVKALEERSNGALTAKIFDSGQLYSSRDAGKAVAHGDTGMAIVATPALARIEPNLNVIDLPLFNGRTQAEMDTVVDGPLGEALSKLVSEKMHVVVPGKWFALGELNTYSTTKPIKSYSDLKGVRIRIAGSASYIERFKAIGAQPVNMPFSDVPLALQQGVVDAIVSSNVSILSAKLNESGIKYGFLNRVGIGYYMPVVSTDYWEGLTPDQQKLFSDTWNEFAPQQRDVAATEQSEAQAALEKQGMQFFEPAVDDAAQASQMTMGLQEKLVSDLGITPDILSLAESATK